MAHSFPTRHLNCAMSGDNVANIHTHTSGDSVANIRIRHRLHNYYKRISRFVGNISTNTEAVVSVNSILQMASCRI